MGVMVYSLLWVLQDLYHQPYHSSKLSEGLLPVEADSGFGGRILLLLTTWVTGAWGRLDLDYQYRKDKGLGFWV